MSIIDQDKTSSPLSPSDQEIDIDWKQCPAFLFVDIECFRKHTENHSVLLSFAAILMALHIESGKYKNIDDISVGTNTDRPDQREIFHKIDQFMAKCYYQYPELEVVVDPPYHGIDVLDRGLSKYLGAPALDCPRCNVMKIVENGDTEHYVYDNCNGSDRKLAEDQQKTK